MSSLKLKKQKKNCIEENHVQANAHDEKKANAIRNEKMQPKFEEKKIEKCVFCLAIINSAKMRFHLNVTSVTKHVPTNLYSPRPFNHLSQLIFE